jgi:hypothetical protein
MTACGVCGGDRSGVSKFCPSCGAPATEPVQAPTLQRAGGVSIGKTRGVSLRKHSSDDLSALPAMSKLSPDSAGIPLVSLEKTPESSSGRTQTLPLATGANPLAPALAQPRLARPQTIFGTRALAAVVVAVAVGVAAFAMGRSGSPSATGAGTPEPAASQAAAIPQVSDAPTPSVTVSATPTPTPPPPDPRVVALAQLNSIRTSDASTLNLSGQWVAQLASKMPGIVDPLQTTSSGSHTFTATDILDEYTQAHDNAEFGSYVRLLLSTDYGNRQLYKGQPLWVTVAIVPTFTSAQDVTAWCAQQFPSLSGTTLEDSCTARTLAPPQ